MDISIFKQSILTLFMANREVIIGPMWYANVLFMSFVILCLLEFLLSKLKIDDEKSRRIRLLITLILMLISSILTNILGVTIPRFNNTLTAVFLIDMSQFLFIKLKWTFSNKYIFIISTLILLNLPLYGHLSMTNNHYENPAFLIIVAICGMYFLFYISQILNGGAGKILCFLGKQSFWIMALHFHSKWVRYF